MFGQTRAAYLSNAFCVLLLWVTFWDNADRRWFLLWTLLSVLLMVAREVQARRYARRSAEAIDTAAWTRWLEVSLLINGVLWGVACASLTLIATPYQLPLIVLIVGGLQTGSVLATSYMLRVFALFSLPLFVPTLSAFVLLGFKGHASLFATAAILAVWFCFIMICASRFGTHYRSSIAHALENFDLAESLKARNGENEALHASLHTRISELKETHRQLLVEKQRSDGLVEQLRELSTTDGLTGLGNRLHFDEHFASEWRRAQRKAQPIALVLCDVDYFKQYNDRYGHQMGDACLVAVAQALAAVIRREGDWAARYGGEEFALIFADTPVGEATARVEEVRARLLERAIEHSGSPGEELVSVSFGVAGVVPTESLTPEGLVASADQALYAAKRTGRNRVVVHGLDPVSRTA